MPARKTAKRRTGSPSAPQRTSVAIVDLTPEAGKLTNKQRLFIEQYFICGLNATEAAMAVYDCKDRHMARAIGAQNLAKLPIRARVDARLAQYHLTAEEVLARIAFHARGSIGAFIDPASGVIDMAHASDAEAFGLIKRYRTKQIVNSKDDTETLETEIELYDAQAALRDIGKHLGLFNDKSLNVNLNITPEQLAAMSDDELAALRDGKPLPPKTGGRA